MLRIILKTVRHNKHLQIHDEELETMDIENKELELRLSSGSIGNDSYIRTTVIGVEVIREK
jgi:hypothetical protein